MKKEHEIFIVYIRTKQVLGMRLKGKDFVHVLHPIPLSQKYIEQRFFKYPEFERKKELAYLVNIGELKITIEETSKGRHMKLYEVLNGGRTDLSLIETKEDNFTSEVIHYMRSELLNVSIASGCPSSIYFDYFLEHRGEHLNKFFTVDDFARRVHTPITNLHRKYRENILLRGEKVCSLDVATMQPLLLGKILQNKIGNNEYSEWINSGEDIYIKLQKKANLNTRDEGKKRFFEILFAPPSDGLSKLFGSANWIEWINSYKKLKIDQNPHNEIKRYSNLAWLLQSTEVGLMYKVWTKLYEAAIPFLSIHDEILVMDQDTHKAESLFNEVLKNEFKYHKLNSKI